MTNTVAIGLAALTAVFILVDLVMFDSEAVLFLSRKFLDFVLWMAFWR